MNFKRDIKCSSCGHYFFTHRIYYSNTAHEWYTVCPKCTQKSLTDFARGLFVPFTFSLDKIEIEFLASGYIELCYSCEEYKSITTTLAECDNCDRPVCEVYDAAKEMEMFLNKEESHEKA